MTSHLDNTVFDGIRSCMQAALRLSDAEAAAITLDTTPVQLPTWTSTAHVELVLALEHRFSLMFEAGEIANLASVRSIVEALGREGAR